MSRVTFTLPIVAIIWFAFFEVLRHRAWLRHRATGFAPGTQGLSVAGSVGSFLLVLAVVAVSIFAHAG